MYCVTYCDVLCNLTRLLFTWFLKKLYVNCGHYIQSTKQYVWSRLYKYRMVWIRLMINWCVCVSIFDHLTCQRLYPYLLHLMTFMTLLNCVVQYSFTLYILLFIWLFMNQFIHVFFILVMDYHPDKLTARSVTIYYAHTIYYVHTY